MGKSLIITEKPSVAQQFAKVLGVSGRNNGYIENDQYIITWCVGHLVTMSYPEKYDESLKKWNLEQLPFLPEKYKYETIASVRGQFKIVKELLNRKDISTIYNAGDSGREGEYIQRLTYQMAGVNRSAQIKRVWIDSQTDEAIRAGLRDAKPSSCYDNLASAAYARAIEDYAIGINFSRALSCKYGGEYNKRIKSDKYKPISVGRVMTCVLGMVVDREREIRNFKPTPFFKIESSNGDFECGWKAVESSHFYKSPLLYDDTGFKTKENAEKFVKGLYKAPALKVKSVKHKEEKKRAPLLYNLAELQNECSRRFKISPDKTLEVAQILYEAKLTTYPRTDARVLSSAAAADIFTNLSGLSGYSHGKEHVLKIMKNDWAKGIEKSQYTNDDKVTDHYAIIPTGQTDTSGLSDLELNIFHLIIDRFLSIFFPPAVYDKVEIELEHPSKEKFFATEKVLKEQGWLEVMGTDSQKASSLDSIKENDTLNVEFFVKEGSTTPPKRYNSGSIILAMENAGNLIEDEELRAQIKGSGIGTSATRAEIIKKLVKNGYIRLNAKTQIITPHEDGEALYDIVQAHVKDLLSPKMTASWEKGLAQIESGEVTQNEYLKKLNAYVRKNVEAVKADTSVPNTNPNASNTKEEKTDYTCPRCRKNLTKRGNKIFCDEVCGFTAWTYFKPFEKEIEPDKMALLLTGVPVTLTGLKSKKGKHFSASATMDDDGKIKLDF